MTKKYHNIGSMIEKRDKNSGNPILDANGKKTYYIKVDKNANIVINGHRVAPGSYINVSRPTDKLDRMLEKGTITPAEHEQKVREFAAGGDKSYIQFELNVTEEK